MGYTIVDSVQMTANHSISATTEDTAETIISGNGFTADGESTYHVHFYAPTARAGVGTAGNIIRVLLQEGDQIVGIWAEPENITGGTKASLYNLSLDYYVRPAAGDHTYKVTAYNLAGTGGLIGGGVGGNGHTNMPAQLIVAQL